MSTKKHVYLFSEGNASMRELLGGKGANLAEMTNIGLIYSLLKNQLESQKKHQEGSTCIRKSFAKMTFAGRRTRTVSTRT